MSGAKGMSVGGRTGAGGAEPTGGAVGPVSAGQLRVELVATEPVAVVAVSGVLMPADGPQVCQRLVDAMAAQPLGLVVDLGDLVVDPAAGEALLPISIAVSAWPERPFALCRRPSSLRPPTVASFPSRELACVHVRDFTTPPHRRLMLDREPAAPQHARRLITRACADWRLDAIVPTAQLVVTELVNNAVIHSGERFLVTVTLTDPGIHIGVHDSSRQLPRLRPPERIDAGGGKGMALVQAFAHDWGATPVKGGKVVWADLRA